MTSAEVVRRVRDGARPLGGDPGDYDELVARAARARIVLLGTATLGSHELLQERARLTRRLVAEAGCCGLAVDADARDAEALDRHVRRRGEAPEPARTIAGLAHFPDWTWRNREVLETVSWLHAFNEPIAPGRRIGLFGLDRFGLCASLHRVVATLDRLDPEAAARARERYSALEQLRPSDEEVAIAAGAVEPSEDDAIAPLVEAVEQDAPDADDQGPVAPPSARAPGAAELYYRALFRGRAALWNVRTGHLADGADELLAWLDRRFGRARLVVWTHAAQAGDARATEQNALGETSLGQLLRERHGQDALLVGFTTYAGAVTAADAWGTPGLPRVLPEAPAGSHEALLHRTGLARLLLSAPAAAAAGLDRDRLERVIGAVYRPQTERRSHTLAARLAEQFDYVIHVDQTRAVQPWQRDRSSETSTRPRSSSPPTGHASRGR